MPLFLRTKRVQICTVSPRFKVVGSEDIVYLGKYKNKTGKTLIWPLDFSVCWSYQMISTGQTRSAPMMGVAEEPPLLHLSGPVFLALLRLQQVLFGFREDGSGLFFSRRVQRDEITFALKQKLISF